MSEFRGTTVLCVSKDGKMAMGADGQVTFGSTVLKATSKKVRKLYHDQVLAGFAGGVADALTLFNRFEAKLEEYRGNLERSAVELVKEWRMDRALRRLEAMLIVADKEHQLLLSGSGELIAPDDGIIAIGSGGPYALASARALFSIRSSTPPRSWARASTSPRRSASTPTARSSWRPYDQDRDRKPYRETDRPACPQEDSRRAGQVHRQAGRCEKSSSHSPKEQGEKAGS